jgi:hypothetical protein
MPREDTEEGNCFIILGLQIGKSQKYLASHSRL